MENYDRDLSDLGGETTLAEQFRTGFERIVGLVLEWTGVEVLISN